MIVVEQLSKSYAAGASELRVLSDVCFRVEAGEYVAVMGASGSGKSTLLNVLGLLDGYDSGRYVLDGQDTRGSASAEFTLDSRKDVVVVEERGLHFDQGRASARVLGPEGRSSERQVRVGLSDGVQIEVLSGLAPGDRVGYADEP